MGEHARSVFRALREAGGEAMLVDIYGPAEDCDRQLVSTYSDFLSPTLGGGVNLFCINGDEVELAFSVLKNRNLQAKGSKNVIYPAWELSKYPDEWAKILDRFDEVWSPSGFIAEALKSATSSPVVHMPLACEVGTRGLYSRRHFGIPDSAYTFFFAFDFLSYMERKNPLAVLEAFEQAIEQRPTADIRLVLKLNNADRKPDAFRQFKQLYKPFRDRVVLIQNQLTDLEMKALMWNCDCFVSLHRSEGFGRGMSEAMALGKPVIATAYSGNLDFCDDQTAFLIPYELEPVGPGEYPHWQDQVWASADTAAAAEAMVRLIDDPMVGVEKGRHARARMLRDFSYLKRGADYLQRAEELAREAQAVPAKTAAAPATKVEKKRAKSRA